MTTKNTATTDYGKVVEYQELTKKQICQFLKVYFGEPVDREDIIARIDDIWNHYSFWESVLRKTEQLHRELSKGEKVLFLSRLESEDEKCLYLKEWAYSKEGEIAVWTQESGEGGFTSFVTISEKDKKSERVLDILAADPEFFVYSKAEMLKAEKGSKEYKCAMLLDIIPYCDRAWEDLSDEEKSDYNPERFRQERLAAEEE